MYTTSKFTSGLFFSITYIFTSELFPTYTRNSMQALCSSLGRIGNVIAAQMPLLVNKLIQRESGRCLCFYFSTTQFSDGILVRIASSHLWRDYACSSSCDDACARNGFSFTAGHGASGRSIRRCRCQGSCKRRTCCISHRVILVIMIKTIICEALCNLFSFNLLFILVLFPTKL